MVIKPYFIVGKSSVEHSTLSSWENELELQNINLIKLNIIDTYLNLTLKTIAMMKWVSMFCNSTKFIAKVDDDTLVDITNLKLVISAAQRCNLTNTFMGRYIGEHRISPPGKANMRWHINNQAYPSDTWPSYTQGLMYIFTSDICDTVLRRVLDRFTPIVNIEDVFLTGIVRVLEVIHLTPFPMRFKSKCIDTEGKCQRIIARTDYDFINKKFKRQTVP